MPWLSRILLVAFVGGVIWIATHGVSIPEKGVVEDDPYASWEKFPVYDPERIPPRLATNPGTPWGDYVGSKACQRCHEEDYDKWRHSFHSRTLYDAAEETIFGDFSDNARYEDPEHPVVVEPFTRTDPITATARTSRARHGWA